MIQTIHTYTDMIHTHTTYRNAKFLVPVSSRASAMRWHAEPCNCVFMMLMPDVAGLRFVRDPLPFTSLCEVSVT